jgi:hypothetical protein
MKTEPDDLTVLYCPVGPKELESIKQSGYRAFPPRLPEQPIFYPVLNEEYAVQIARDWNAATLTIGVGYVIRFRVRSEYLKKFVPHMWEVRFIGSIGFLLRNSANSIPTLSVKSKCCTSFL